VSPPGPDGHGPTMASMDYFDGGMVVGPALDELSGCSLILC
jgi:hypothetical protein